MGRESNFKSAARVVLSKSHTPMTAKEITDAAFDLGILDTEGATPEATMAAQLYVDIRDNDESDFIKVSAGKFSLRSTEDSFSGEQYVAKHNQEVRATLKSQLHEMDPSLFESLIAALLDKIGFENVEVTGGTSDGGIDVVGDLTVGGITNVKTVIQAKRYSSNVSTKVIRELRGSTELTKRGLIITTAGFTKDAISEASQSNKMPITLVDGKKLLDLLIEHEVGVKSSQVRILSIDESLMDSISDFEKSDVKDGRTNAIWPLPGGINAYKDTLTKFLTFVKASKPDKGTAIKWFIEKFDTVHSEKTSGGYVNVPRMLNLTTKSDGKIVLSDKGEQFVSNPGLQALREVLEESLNGVREILEVLETKVMTEKEIWKYLVDALDVNWTTINQTKWRLVWLINAGAISKDSEGHYQLNGVNDAG